MQELCNHLRQRRKKDREAVTEDDCLRAISKLKVYELCLFCFFQIFDTQEKFELFFLVSWIFPQVLGSGFEVITIGKKKLVRSVPTELNKDHNQILELAQVIII